MKKTKKIVALVLAAVMLVCTTVVATVAYLTSQTKVVENTFTVGNVEIMLDEKDVDKETDNNVDDITTDPEHNGGEARDRANIYHLLPGKSYEKDPTVWVEKGSEKCWVFVKVVNNIAGIEATDAITIAQQMDANGWKSLDVENVYYYENIVDAFDAKEDAKLVIFESFKITGNIANEDLAEYATTADETNVITVEAYAVQAEGFDSAVKAWKAAPATWKA